MTPIKINPWPLAALLLLFLVVIYQLTVKPHPVHPTLLPRLTLSQPHKVIAVAITPDGTTIASSEEVMGRITAYIYLWNGRTGALERTLPGNGESVNAIAISPDGKTLVSTERDSTLKSWDIGTGRLLWTHTGPETAYALAFSPDGAMVADYGNLYDVKTGRLRRVLPVHGHIFANAAFSPDGKIFVSTVGNWKIVNKSQAELAVHEPGQLPDGIKSIGERVQLWDLDTGKPKRTLPYDLTQAVAFSPDGKWLYCLNTIADIPTEFNGSILRCVSLQTGSVRWIWKQREEASSVPAWSMMSLTCTPGGTLLAGEGADGSVHLFQAATGRLLRTLPCPSSHGGGFNTTHGLAFSGDGKTLVSRGGRAKAVYVWDTSRYL